MFFGVNSSILGDKLAVFFHPRNTVKTWENSNTTLGNLKVTGSLGFLGVLPDLGSGEIPCDRITPESRHPVWICTSFDIHDMASVEKILHWLICIF